MKIFSYLFSILFFIIFSLHGNNKNETMDTLVSGNAFRSLANHFFDERCKTIVFHTIKDGDIIFVKTDMLSNFFRFIHPKISKKYILITHNSDHECSPIFQHYLDEQKILAWFGQNPGFQHPKFYPIPIGKANEEWAHGNTSCFLKMMDKKKESAKQYLLYANFNPKTHPDRLRLYNFFSKQSFCRFQRSPLALELYLQDLLSSEYVLSPRGNGLDTHRSWEALFMGAIPIVQHSFLDSLFSNMRILLVDNFYEITEDFLKKQLLILSLHKNNENKFYLKYYAELIDEIKNKL